MTNTLLKTIILSITILLTSSVHAQQYIFPEKGQSTEQQQKDEYTCHSWAVGEVGFDPTATQSSPAPIATPAPPATNFAPFPIATSVPLVRIS